MHSRFQILFFCIVLIADNTFSQNGRSTMNVKKDTVKITIKGLGKPLNSPFADYAPVISADGLTMMFTSRRPVTPKEIQKGKPVMEHIYSASYDATKKKWSEGICLSDSINEPGRNNSAIALSNDGQTLFLYRDDDSGNGDIYLSTLKGKDWTRAVKLPSTINSTAHESSASLSPDGNTLYFVSDRKGGQGKRDIWYSKKDGNNQWEQAINLGPMINTKEDEEGVFIHPDGKTLYFSSKGHESLGGYDICYSTYVNDHWSPPRNLGKAINTIGDDVFLVITADGANGYYSTDKSGGIGEKDIYLVKSAPVKKTNKPKLTLFTGIVIDKETLLPLESDIVIMDNQKNTVLSTIKSNSASGKFLISLPSGKNYGINVKKNGYLFYSDNVSISDTAAYKEIVKTIPLEKIKIGNKIVLKNIFYDFDKASLRPESKSELEELLKLMNENQTIKIELSSYTDNKGSDDYNLKLSQERAQSVVDYLISKGISKERLVAKGYGESKPISDNDTETGRQMNRRTEFEVLSN